MKTFILPLFLISISCPGPARADDDAEANAAAQQIAGAAVVGIGTADLAVHAGKSNAIAKEYKKLAAGYLAEISRLSAEQKARLRQLAPEAAEKLDAIRAKDPRDLALEPSDRDYRKVQAVKDEYRAARNHPEIREYDRLIKAQIDKLHAIQVRAGWTQSMVPYRPMQLMEKSVHELGLAVRGLGIAGAGAGLIYLGIRGEEKIEKADVPAPRAGESEQAAEPPEQASSATLGATDAQ